MNKARKKICIVSTVGISINAFMIKHIEYLQQIAEVTLVSGDDTHLNSNAKVKILKIERKINILQDLKTSYELYKFFKQEKFDVVLSLMPKSGLLSMLASYCARVPVRIHFFTGQVWVTKKGLFRILLKNMDKVIVKCSTNVLVDSNSQKQFLIDENILEKGKGFVLNKGSISGVSLEKFKFDLNIRQKLRKQYNILDHDIVFMFLGRINRDKGILDLCEVFLQLFRKYANIKLFIIGMIESDDLRIDLKEILANENVIAELHYCDNPEILLNITDVVTLPSYREGFGTIVIEAASMNIPTIGSEIYGLQDAIVNNQTGVLHKVASINEMISKYSDLIENRAKIKQLGQNAFERVQSDFRDEYLSKDLLNFIEDKLCEKK